MARSNGLLRILGEARACTVCAEHLPLGPRPLLAAGMKARVLLIGQAPGRSAHESGIPWADRSGDRLRDWLGIDRDTFYDPNQVALLPMGFCYPGSGKQGDLQPRKECAPLWHPQVLPLLKKTRLTIYLGRYAVERNLGDRYGSLTAAAEAYEELLPDVVALPHPSPRNGMWTSKRPWFSEILLPMLRARVRESLS
ncbi:MAG: uracil-DNA glycosylase family protein [Chloroflexi bacterium]|nr:uracil-DNA glycosylase family protein [Acidobacteriota bacterium]MDA1175222.1 uracil-DNA glycosylase family protein [Chloroflexota bacterium]